MTLVQELAKAVIDNHIAFTQMGNAYCVHCEAENYKSIESGKVSHLPNCVYNKARLLLKHNPID